MQHFNLKDFGESWLALCMVIFALNDFFLQSDLSDAIQTYFLKWFILLQSHTKTLSLKDSYFFNTKLHH